MLDRAKLERGRGPSRAAPQWSHQRLGALLGSNERRFVPCSVSQNTPPPSGPSSASRRDLAIDSAVDACSSRLCSKQGCARANTWSASGQISRRTGCGAGPHLLRQPQRRFVEPCRRERMRVRENEDEGERRGRRERIAARARANRRRPRPRGAQAGRGQVGLQSCGRDWSGGWSRAKRRWKRRSGGDIDDMKARENHRPLRRLGHSQPVFMGVKKSADASSKYAGTAPMRDLQDGQLFHRSQSLIILRKLSTL